MTLIGYKICTMNLRDVFTIFTVDQCQFALPYYTCIYSCICILQSILKSQSNQHIEISTPCSGKNFTIQDKILAIIIEVFLCF